MWIRYSSGACLILAFALVGTTGCKKGSEAAQSQPLASIHWLGAKRIAADTNAAHLVKIAAMPETRRMVNQTLDKLALAPWRAEFKGVDWKTTTNYAPLVAGNAHARLLRPLLEDVLASESHIQTRKAEKQPAEFAIAIRLEPARANVWKTNLAALAATKGSFLSGAKLSQSGPWTVVVSGKAGEQLVSELKARAAAPGSNDWIISVLNLRNLAQALKISHPALSDLPEANMVINGSRGAVRTRATLQFAKPLQIQLDPWIVPTNIINEPLVGFSAARGIRPVLASTEFWREQKLGTPPNQVYFWAQQGPPWFHFFAAPSKEADAQATRLGEYIISEANPVLEYNKLGTMTKGTRANRVGWKGLPLFAPNVGADTNMGIPFITGGFYLLGLSNKPMPAELLKQLHADTNLVWYDWELTRFCAEGWMGIGQLCKNALGYPRLTHAVAFEWLNAARTNLANCTTVIKKDGASSLSLSRDSAIGMTGAELALLVDWLESPDFPEGLHTFRANRPPPFLKRSGTFTEVALPEEQQASPTNPPPAPKAPLSNSPAGK